MGDFYPAAQTIQQFDPYTPLAKLAESRKTLADAEVQKLNVAMGQQRLNVLKSVLGDGSGGGGSAGAPATGGPGVPAVDGAAAAGGTGVPGAGLSPNQLQALAIASPESANALVNTRKGMIQADQEHLALRTNALFQAVAGANDQKSWDQNLDWAYQNGYLDQQDYAARKQQGFSELGRSQLLDSLGGADNHFKMQGIFAEKGVRQNPDGSVTPLPGYIAAQAGLEGAKASAEAAGKFPYENALQLNKPAEIAPGGMRVVPGQINPGGGFRMPSGGASAPAAPAPVRPVTTAPLAAPRTAPVNPTGTPAVAPIVSPVAPPVAPVGTSPAGNTIMGPTGSPIAKAPIVTQGPGGTTITNPNSPALMGPLPAYNEKTGAAVADYITGKQAAVSGVNDTLFAIQDLRKSLKDLPTGPGTATANQVSNFLSRFGIDANKALPDGWQTDPTKASIAQKNIAQLASAWAKGTYPTRITDSDMRIAFSAMPSLDLNNAKANEHLMDNLEAVQRIKLEEAKYLRTAAHDMGGASPDWTIMDNWQQHLFDMKGVPDPVKRSYMAYSDIAQHPQVAEPPVNTMPAGAVNYATGPNGEKGFIFAKPNGGYYFGDQNGGALK